MARVRVDLDFDPSTSTAIFTVVIIEIVLAGIFISFRYSKTTIRDYLEGVLAYCFALF
jgi:hypothetical protein